MGVCLYAIVCPLVSNKRHTLIGTSQMTDEYLKVQTGFVRL